MLNFRRKQISGLSLDFVVLNVVGFSAYAIFTSLLTWMPQVRQAFQDRNNGALPPVEANDVVFALHGVFCTYLVAFQCMLYPLQPHEPRVRFDVAVTCVAAGICLVVGFLFAYFGSLHWMVYIQFCGILKFLASFIKYVPQVVLNYQRKSTHGFSISGILLDFIGGVFSMTQQTLRAIMLANLSPFTKNFAKTGLGLESLMFDCILIFQHYWLYSGAKSVDLDVEEAGEEVDVPLVSDADEKGDDF